MQSPTCLFIDGQPVDPDSWLSAVADVLLEEYEADLTDYAGDEAEGV